MWTTLRPRFGILTAVLKVRVLRDVGDVRFCQVVNCYRLIARVDCLYLHGQAVEYGRVFKDAGILHASAIKRATT